MDCCIDMFTISALHELVAGLIDLLDSLSPIWQASGLGFYSKELHRKQLSHTTSNLEVHSWADVIIIAWK